jgi:hypothetical protein
LRAVRRVPVRSSAAAAAAPIQKRAEPHATSDSGGGTSPRDARLLGKLQEAMLLLGAEGTSEATDGGGDTDSERTARIQAKLQLAMSLMGGSDLGEESESAAASVAARDPSTRSTTSDKGDGAEETGGGDDADATASEAPARKEHAMPTVHISRRGSITVTMAEEGQQRTPPLALEAVATHAAANTAFIVAHRAASEAMGAANSAYSQLKEDLAARLMQTTARSGSAKKEVRMLRSIAIARDAPRRPRSGSTVARAATSPRANAVCSDLGKALANNDAVSAGACGASAARPPAHSFTHCREALARRRHRWCSCLTPTLPVRFTQPLLLPCIGLQGGCSRTLQRLCRDTSVRAPWRYRSIAGTRILLVDAHRSYVRAKSSCAPPLTLRCSGSLRATHGVSTRAPDSVSTGRVSRP